MRLSRLGRVVFASIAALLVWLVIGAVRRRDTFAAVTYGGMALMFGLPALFGRDSFTAHTIPVPRWLRWLYPAPAPEPHASSNPPAP